MTTVPCVQFARSGAERMRRIVPRPAISVALALSVAASLTPGLLPRSAPTQAVVTGVFAAIGVGAAGIERRNGSARGRGIAAVAGGGVVAVAVVAAARWQNSLRAAMDKPATTPAHWLGAIAGAAVVAGILVGCARGIVWLIRKRPALVGAFGCAMLLIGVPTLVDWRQAVYRTSSAALDSAVHQPLSPLRSGSPASLAAWTTLGAEGREFVSGTGRAVRVYVGIDSAPDLIARVRLALDELDRTGGLSRGNVVVAVPTGSGWIDANAVAGLEERFGDDVAIVGIQYSYAPSWATFVFGREAALASATALYDAVAERISALPVRPRLYLYGQSLGSVGGSAALQDHDACAALWAGPPAGTLAGNDAVVLANSSDPVVRWSPRLLIAPPDLGAVRRDAPAPPWLPVISFVQTTVDLFDALDTPAGHGHRYGTDQGTSMPSC